MAAAPSEKPQVFLESDDEIRGQKYVCLSFLTPSKELLGSKDIYVFSKFIEFYALDYKIRATESFVLGQLRDTQNVLGDVEMDLQNATAETDLPALAAKVAKIREQLSRKTATDLETHVKTNMSDFKESTIQESFETFMLKNREQLEDDFHKQHKFQTTMHGLKVRGIYGTNEQAAARAKQLHSKDPYFNVYVADVGEWLPWDPNPETVQGQEYSNEQLNKLMSAYRDNSAKKDAFYEEEKRQKLSDAAAAASASKKAMFGEKGKELEAAEVGREIFDGIDADLAIARKAAATGNAGGATISHE